MDSVPPPCSSLPSWAVPVPAQGRDGAALGTGPHLHLRVPVPQNATCAFPDNDCAVYSGFNELKEKSCWERLLILYQQLTSFVLDLCKWFETYNLKVSSFGTNDWKFICAASLFSCWTEFICKHTSTFLLLKSERNTYGATLCIFHISKHSCLDCLYARLWSKRSSIAALCWRASSNGNAKMISLLYV